MRHASSQRALIETWQLYQQWAASCSFGGHCLMQCLVRNGGRQGKRPGPACEHLAPPMGGSVGLSEAENFLLNLRREK